MTPKMIDLAFKKAEQQISDSLIRYKTKSTNPYWGKVPNSGSFPSKSGTSIKIVKLGRTTVYPPRWQGISDEYCSTNACGNPAQEIMRHGFMTDSYSLAKTSIKTDWICLSSLVFREMAGTELKHFEEALQMASSYVWNEFGRSRYIHSCQNKVVAFVDESDLTKCPDAPRVKCTDQNVDTDAFMWARYQQADGTPGEINENYVFVKVDPEKIETIAQLSLDMLDLAAEDLEQEDDTMPFLSEGITLFDVVLGTTRIGHQFVVQEDRQANNAISYGGYNAKDLFSTLGTKNVFRDRFSTRTDNESARFYPDVSYNEALVAQEGYAFSATDPDTWPRFKRVYRYRPTQSTSGEGVVWVPNKENYMNAPFVISTILAPGVCSFQNHPETSDVGSAKRQGQGLDQNYAGRARWINPDWECNEDRDKGFWKMDYGAAVKPEKGELGFAYFHRVDRKLTLFNSSCDIPTATCHPAVSPYCYEGMTGDEESLNGTRGQIRPMGGVLTIR